MPLHIASVVDNHEIATALGSDFEEASQILAKFLRDLNDGDVEELADYLKQDLGTHDRDPDTRKEGREAITRLLTLGAKVLQEDE